MVKGCICKGQLQINSGSDTGLNIAGSGASGEGNTKGWGNRPFLDLLDVESGDKQRLWQSTPPRYEFSGALVVDTNSDAPIRCWTPPLNNQCLAVALNPLKKQDA